MARFALSAAEFSLDFAVVLKQINLWRESRPHVQIARGAVIVRRILATSPRGVRVRN